MFIKTKSNKKVMIEITKINCPTCSSNKIRKYGIQKSKQQKQRYQCKECEKIFLLHPNNKSYPEGIILNSISYCNLGYTQKEVSKLIAKKFKINIPQKTISNWINEFKEVCPYSRLRNEAKQQFKPENIIDQYEFLHNNLNYKYQIHNFKLNYLTNNNEKLERIKTYLEKIPTKEFPHHIFKPIVQQGWKGCNPFRQGISN